MYRTKVALTAGYGLQVVALIPEVGKVVLNSDASLKLPNEQIAFV